jgi:putative phosphoserine phosphatase/1-acylglycerol-3-phosphate O-acyltransferase
MSQTPTPPAVAAFFDLDDTLIAGDSDVLWYDYLSHHGRIGWRERLWMRWHYRRYRQGHSDVDTFVAMQTRTIAGASLDDVRRWYEDCFAGHIRGRLFPEAGRLVNTHRRRGHRLVLCTGANTLRCDPVRRHLELDAVLGTELEVADGRCTGHIVGEFCTGAEKATRLERYAAEHGVDLEISYAYGDSDADLPMLEAVGHPIVVNPDSVLRDVAKERGWPILRFLPSGVAPPSVAVQKG